MKKLSRLIMLTFLGVLLSCGKSSSPAKKYKIAVIPKGTTHEFWKSIHAGALKAEQELAAHGSPVEVIWKGPLREDDREQQVAVVEGFISQKVNGMVLAPLDNHALVRPVEEARRAGIATVIIDSGLESDSIVSFVATDNVKGGELAADQMGKLLGGQGKVLMLRTQEGSASTLDREAGFLRRITSDYPRIKVISSDQYAGSTRDTAQRASESLLNRYGADLDGIFTSAEPTTAGMLLALQDMNKAGRVTFIGFDAHQTFIDALRHQQLQGIVVQNPFKMGYLGVKTMVDHLQGKPVERKVDTRVTIITLENLDTPEAQELLHPPLDQYLKG